VLLEYHPFDNPAPDVYSDPDAVVQGFFPPRAPRDAPTERAVRHAFYPGTQSVHVGQSLVFSRDIVDAVTAQPRLRVLLSYGTTACTTPDGRIEHASMSKDQQPPLTRLASGMKTRATMHVVPHGSHFWFADPRYSQAVADIGKWVTTRTEWQTPVLWCVVALHTIRRTIGLVWSKFLTKSSQRSWQRTKSSQRSWQRTKSSESPDKVLRKVLTKDKGPHKGLDKVLRKSSHEKKQKCHFMNTCT